MIDVKLESDRLLIRPFKLGDEEAMFELNSNPIVQKYTGDEMINSVEEAKNLLENVVFKDYQKHGYGRLAVIYKPDNKLIGFTGIKYLPEAKGESDLGYRFLPEYWGKGIATESSKMSLKFGFEKLNLKKIIGFTEIENEGSSNVLLKMGFRITKIDYYPGEENTPNKKPINWFELTKESYERQ
ncbi:MAG: GNAT family N-acetyltransferase [Flavobacterium sp.]|nr:MAG: GNAT family N-acetyltransferase [Flavobacterium sp.]